MEWVNGDTIGCGIVVSPENKGSIFYTKNGAIILSEFLQINYIHLSNFNLQTSQIQIALWLIASIQLSPCGTHHLKPILATTRTNHLNSTFTSVQDCFWSEIQNKKDEMH
jgi:hypothetical protein